MKKVWVLGGLVVGLSVLGQGAWAAPSFESRAGILRCAEGAKAGCKLVTDEGTLSERSVRLITAIDGKPWGQRVLNGVPSLIHGEVEAKSEEQANGVLRVTGFEVLPEVAIQGMRR